MTKTKYNIDFQCYLDAPNVPDRFHIQRWISAALESRVDIASLCVKIVCVNEIQELNRQYRSKDMPTNVLSFPMALPEDIDFDERYLGDIVICATVVEEEAHQQDKPIEAHWAHMLIHGTLHLLGYDHILDEDAKVMEHLETSLLKNLGYQDPYSTNEEIFHE